MDRISNPLEGKTSHVLHLIFVFKEVIETFLSILFPYDKMQIAVCPNPEQNGESSAEALLPVSSLSVP